MPVRSVEGAVLEEDHLVVDGVADRRRRSARLKRRYGVVADANAFNPWIDTRTEDRLQRIAAIELGVKIEGPIA